MPLPDPAPRRKFHNRAINCEGFAREDGLWDIEARITDTKTYAFENQWRGAIEPGDGIHDMWVRLTVDDNRVIHDVAVAMDGTPFEICPSVEPNFKALIGVRIAAGWNVAVRKRVGGTSGCTHVVELLAVMATVAFQTIGTGIARRDEWLGRDTADAPDDKTASRPAGWDPESKGEKPKPPPLLDTCVAWGRSSPVVKRIYPEFYEESRDED
ncbi:MAG: DUF2889 domain-containing protein [Sphingomonadales bacterium]